MCKKPSPATGGRGPGELFHIRKQLICSDAGGGKHLCAPQGRLFLLLGLFVDLVQVRRHRVLRGGNFEQSPRGAHFSRRGEERISHVFAFRRIGLVAFVDSAACAVQFGVIAVFVLFQFVYHDGVQVNFVRSIPCVYLWTDRNRVRRDIL